MNHLLLTMTDKGTQIFGSLVPSFITSIKFEFEFEIHDELIKEIE